jgi:hypothetical protein
VATAHCTKTPSPSGKRAHVQRSGVPTSALDVGTGILKMGAAVQLEPRVEVSLLSTGCPGAPEADAGASVDAGTGTATPEFASTLRGFVSAAALVEPGMAPEDVRWSVTGSVRDLQYELAPGATLRVGPSGGPSSTFVVPGQFSFDEVFSGEMSAFTASLENGPALLQGTSATLVHQRHLAVNAGRRRRASRHDLVALRRAGGHRVGAGIASSAAKPSNSTSEACTYRSAVWYSRSNSSSGW